MLSQKWKKTERTIYYDAENRGTWQPLLSQLFQLDKARLMLINRYEYLYRKASFNFDQCNDTQKPVYLKLMLDITNNLLALLGLQSLQASENEAHYKELAEEEFKLIKQLLDR